MGSYMQENKRECNFQEDSFVTSNTDSRTPHLMSKKVITENTVSVLTLRRLMSYIYGAPILDVSRSHTTTQHSQ